MKLLQTIQGIIAEITKDGSGALRTETGRLIFVYGTIPCETVTAKMIKRVKEAFRGQLISIDRPSKDRVIPACPHARLTEQKNTQSFGQAGICGGCKWQHIAYPFQVELKLAEMQKAFAAVDIPCPIAKILPSPEPFFYRNRMDFVFGANGELGMKAPDRWWDVLNLTTCLLLSRETKEILDLVRDWTKKSGLPFWNSKEYKGFFRYLVIREGKNTNERMVTLVTAPPSQNICQSLGGKAMPPVLAEFAEILAPLATSILWGINGSITDLSTAEQVIPLKGDPWIHEEVNNIRYKITPNAFFQTNTHMAAKLQKIVLDFCGDISQKTILDLYCGSGFFSLALTRQSSISSLRTPARPEDSGRTGGRSLERVIPPLARGRMKQSPGGIASSFALAELRTDRSSPATPRNDRTKIIGIELSAEAIACAKENAAINGRVMPNGDPDGAQAQPSTDGEIRQQDPAVDFVVSKAEDFDWKRYKPEVVVLDPPRAGLHPRVIETILAALPETIVYVSCNYHRTIQELPKFLEKYDIADAVALDLFPQTPHVECVFKLIRRNGVLF